ncbi:MAG: ATP-binding cassette domain-containing protein [Pseudomonadota bacterium]
MSRFAIGHSRSRTKQKLEQIYATACRWLDVAPDDCFVDAVLDDGLTSPDGDLGSALISKLLTEQFSMPPAARGLIGIGLLHAIVDPDKQAGEGDAKTYAKIDLTADEISDLDGLASRLLLTDVDPVDVRRAAAFVVFLLSTHGPKALVEFGRAMGPDGSVNKASEAATGKSSAVLELEWKGTASNQDLKMGPWHVMVWTARAARHFPKLLFFFLVANAIQIAYTVVVPVWIQRLFDDGIQQSHIGVIELMLTFLVVGFLLTSAAGVVLDYCVAALGPKMLERMRFRMFNKLQRMSARSLSRYGSDEVVANFSNDLTVLEKAIIWSVPGLFAKSLILVGSVGVAFHLDWQLAVPMLVAMGLAFWLPRLIGKWALRKTHERGIEDTKLIRVVKENALLQRVIHAFGLTSTLVDRFRVQLDGLYRSSLGQYFSSGLVGRATNFGISSSQLIVIGLGAVLSVEGEVSAGTIVAFITLLLSIGGAAGFLGSQLPVLIQAVGSLQRIEVFLAQPDEIKTPETVESMTLPLKAVTFDNVSFSYQGDKVNLDEISMQIDTPQRVAIVGPSGSGKSTLLSLIEHQFDPTEGRIFFNGIDLSMIGDEQRNALVNVVPQEPLLFQASVRENIRMGKLDATDEEIEEAAKKAEIHDFIASLPDGYDTDSGEAGRKFSGGQRQRIAIARAIINNPEILLLDEATSALDEASAAAINETLERVTRGRTVFAVTHHLNDCEAMDQVLVLKDGKIVESGTHKELVAREGAYADLWSAHTIANATDDLSPDDIIRMLGRFTLFEDVPAETMETVFKTMRLQTVQTGTRLLEEGQSAERFVLIVKGTVERTVRLPSGEIHELELLDAGDALGEYTILDDARNPATATTKTDCTLLSINKSELLELLGDDQRMLTHVKTMLRAREDEIREHITWRKLFELAVPGA